MQAFKVGDTVIVTDLIARPDLNDQEYKLVEFDAQAGRWRIVLPDGSNIRIKPENLLLGGPPAKKLHVSEAAPGEL